MLGDPAGAAPPGVPAGPRGAERCPRPRGEEFSVEINGGSAGGGAALARVSPRVVATPSPSNGNGGRGTAVTGLRLGVGLRSPADSDSGRASGPGPGAGRLELAAAARGLRAA